MHFFYLFTIHNFKKTTLENAYNMKTPLILLILVYSISPLWSQKWIDTTYQINTVTNIEYGRATDFAGAERQLLMDISVPTNDTPPECGRPLMVIVHGGAWLAGSKDEVTIKRLRTEFAKRGYTAIAVNYRLGQFHTDRNIHCNVEGWDCFNIADSSEWYRAYFRAVQDVNGAIRYMINNADEYNIDPNNVFLAGESAGAFTAIGTAFIDSEDDVLSNFTQELPDIATPNNLYETPCIQELEIANSIDEMKLERPDLGSYQGKLNQQAKSEYTIRGVAGFYGGVMNNIFPSDKLELPALYMFHQPNDLIVPINYGTVFEGYNQCTRDILSCQNIVNRKSLWGSVGITNILDTMEAIQQLIPTYKIELTNNNANCIEQIADPSKGGHQYDNYWNRTNSAATFLAEYIVDCVVETGLNSSNNRPKITIFPNPTRDSKFYINNAVGKIVISNSYGQILMELQNLENHLTLDLQEYYLTSGVYFISIANEKNIEYHKFIVR